MSVRTVLVMNGPNLNLLGTREPDVYGRETLEDLENVVRRYAGERGIAVSCFQSNSEGALIGAIHAAPGTFDGIIYNPGAHTHYSYALRDAIGSIDVPVVEVHLSDIDSREAFRATSVVAPACVAQVKGLGIEGYCRALDILCDGAVHARLGEGYELKAAGGNVLVGDEVGAHDSSAKVSDTSSEPSTELISDAISEAFSGALSKAPIVMGASQEASVSASAGEPSDASSEELSEVSADKPSEAPAEASVDTLSEMPSEAPAEKAVEAASDELGEDLVSAPADTLSETSSSAESLRNYAAAFAEEIAAIDAGALSSERCSLIQKTCDWLGIRGLLVRDTSNVQWLTALDGVFDEERAHALLIADNRAVLHTDSRYANAVRTGVARIGSNLVVNDDRVSHYQFAFNELTWNGEVKLVGRTGIEDSITYAEFVHMVERFGRDGLAPTSEIVLKQRAVKDAGEIVRLKAAQAITDAAFAHIVAFMKVGMTEREVQLELEDFMVRHGAESLAFRSIVATGANGADPHAVPGSTRLEAGQCVVMDFGAKAYGYCSDMTRTVFLGEPEGDMARAWDTMRRANEAVESMLKPGVTGAEAHALAEQVLEEGGFGGCMGHGLGHGVGIDVHELPNLNPRNETALVEGNVVTVEPGIYLPGRFGMRLEDFGVITATGFEVFTQTSHEPVVL